VCFDPTIDCNENENGIRDILQHIIDDFVSLAVLIPRLDGSHDEAGDFLVEIKDQFMLFGTIQTLENNFTEMLDATQNYIES
jgi:hypothetical protein